MIKKIVVNFIVIAIVSSLIYSKLINFIEFRGVYPDLLLILTVFVGIFNGGYFGMIFGFFIGFALDLFNFPLFGFYSLIYTIIGYSTSIFENKIDVENPLVSSIIILIELFLKALLFLFIGLMFLESGIVKHYFKSKFLIEIIYTILVSIPVFLIYNKIYSSKKSKNKFM